MEFLFTIVIFVVILLLVLIGLGAKSANNTRPATFKLLDEEDNTVVSKHGNSVGEAADELFHKLYKEAMSVAKPETVQDRIYKMEKALLGMCNPKYRFQASTLDRYSSLIQQAYERKRHLEIRLQSEKEARQQIRQLEASRKETEKTFRKLYKDVIAPSSLTKLADAVATASRSLTTVDINCLDSSDKEKYIILKNKLEDKGASLFNEYIEGQFQQICSKAQNGTINLEIFEKELRKLLIQAESTQRKLPRQTKDLLLKLKSEVGLDE